MEEEKAQLDEALAIRLGRNLVSWEIDEYTRHLRGPWWYLVAGLLAAGMIVYAIATANFLFAVIILMTGIITLLTSFQSPKRVDVIVTTTGVIVGDMYYEYKAIKDFSIAYNPPTTKLLYLSFHVAWQPMLAIPLEDTDPNDVRESLLPYCLENLERNEERLTDVLRRMYKL